MDKSTFHDCKFSNLGKTFSIKNSTSNRGLFIQKSTFDKHNMISMNEFAFNQISLINNTFENVSII